MSVLVIAEAGVNHNGDADLAARLVDVAADTGADVVKFQTFTAERLVTRRAAKADYQRTTTDAAESQFDMIRRLELTPAMHDMLIARCARAGIGFLSTAFDTDSLDYLLGLGMALFKVPSGELTNLPYLRHVGRFGKRVILSSGMGTLGEVERALLVLEESGTPRSSVTVLHCTTEYPTPVSEVNLRAMETIHRALGVAVGYSDHTPGIEVAIAAAALGATVIEKHFTLDRSLPGPDHRASLEPDELAAMVRGIRHIEHALGDGIKRPMPSERKNASVARKSIVARIAIQAGERFTEANLTVKRPGTGLSPMLWDVVLGRRASRAFEPDELIEL